MHTMKKPEKVAYSVDAYTVFMVQYLQIVLEKNKGEGYYENLCKCKGRP